MAKRPTKTSACKVFDQAAERENKAAPPRDFSQSEKRLRTLIDKLPQRDVIEDRHVDRWITRTLKMSIDRVELELGEGKADIPAVHEHALWHVRRASAIGGSEMGTIVKHFRGDRGNFTSARNLAMEKLLIMAPMRSTPEMARGNRAEPWLQRMYHEEHGVRSDEAMLDALKGFRWDRLPQIVGTPDDIVVLPDDRRRLVDYKAPSADVNAEYEKDGISFDYVCQVHHYAILAQASGSRISEMEIAAFDPRYFLIHQYEVERDPDLIREIMSSATTFWDDFVMVGALPDDIAPDNLQVEEDEMRDIGVQAAIMKVLSGEVEARQKELLERVSAMGSEWHELAVGKLDLGFATFDRSRKWDEEALTEIARSVGVVPEDYISTTTSMDTDRAKEMLEALHETITSGEDPGPALADLARSGVPMKAKMDLNALAEAVEAAGANPTPAAGLQERFSISRKKSGEEADRVRAIKAHVIDLADTLEDVISEEGTKILRGDAEEEEPSLD